MAAVNAFKVRAIIEAGYDKSSLSRANKDIQQSYSQLAVKLKQVTNASRITQTTAAGVGAAAAAGGSFKLGIVIFASKEFVCWATWGCQTDSRKSTICCVVLWA